MAQADKNDARNKCVTDAVQGLFQQGDSHGGEGQLHHVVVEQEHQRHADDTPVNRIRLDETDAPAGQQCHHHRFGGENQDGVRVVPQHQSDAAHHQRTRHTQSRSEQLQGEHGEDAAEQEVDAVKDREDEVIPRQAESGEEDKSQQRLSPGKNDRLYLSLRS